MEGNVCARALVVSKGTSTQGSKYIQNAGVGAHIAEVGPTWGLFGAAGEEGLRNEGPMHTLMTCKAWTNFGQLFVKKSVL